MVEIVGITSRNGLKQLTGIELLSVDLMNHFMTIKGELDWNSEYGTTIPLKLFEPKSETISAEIKDEVQRVLNNEPKIQSVRKIIVTEQEKGYTCECEIIRAEQLTPETLFFNFKP